ncbi:DUF1508 domain-containing protein [Sphingomonas koreensis]
MNFEIFKVEGTDSSSACWGWRLLDEHGARAAYGEGYATKRDCKQAIAHLMSSDSKTPIRVV